MNHPKFAVGEEVILESKEIPEHNGIYVVEGVLGQFDQWKCRETGQIKRRIDPGYGYLLNTIFIREGKTAETSFSESALRKKHQPGQSFQSLMSELTNAKPKLLEKK